MYICSLAYVLEIDENVECLLGITRTSISKLSGKMMMISKTGQKFMKTGMGSFPDLMCLC
jgi:hypothetical protein